MHFCACLCMRNSHTSHFAFSKKLSDSSGTGDCTRDKLIVCLLVLMMEKC